MKSRIIFRIPLGAALLVMVFSVALSAQSDADCVRGVVKSSSGRPFSSVWVVVSQNGDEKGRSLTGDDGRYYIANLGDGGYDLAVYRGNDLLYRGRVDLQANSRQHDILIQRIPSGRRRSQAPKL